MQATRTGVFLLECLAILSGCGEEWRGESPAERSCFVPTLQDPDFARTSGWNTVGGATIAPGAAQLAMGTICDHGGVEQTMLMPALDCARPVVMHMAFSLDGIDGLNLALGVNGGWSSPRLDSGSSTVDTCLGAAAFGGSTRLFLGGGDNAGLCSPPTGDDGRSLSIEHVDIEVDDANVCPPPGTVPDGDFEAGGARWSTRPGGGTAEIAQGRGEDGSFGAHLATDRPCEIPSIVGTISLPTSAMIPNPALRVWSNGSSNATASVRIGPLFPLFLTSPTYIEGKDAPRATDICIPRWAAGTVQPLELAIVSTSYTEACGDLLARDMTFDNLSFVSDPACEAGALLFDPGFEQGALAPGATPYWSLDNYTDQPDAKVALEVDAAAAHSGSGRAVFSVATPCPEARLSGVVTVPHPVGGAGGALKFWYKTGVGLHARLDVSLAALLAPVALPPAHTWTQVTACLDRRLAGRPDLLRFSVVSADGGGLCADEFPVETFEVDDVELTTDVGCPTP
jgi:hypothetical protein